MASFATPSTTRQRQGITIVILHTYYVGLAQANILFCYLNLLLLLLYFLLRGLGPHYSEGFKATSTKLGRDLGPDVKFYDLSFQTDQTYSFFFYELLNKTKFPLTYIEIDKILLNATPPRALKPRPPNSPERWALMCSFMLYLFRLIRIIVFLLLIVKNDFFPIDLH